MNNLPAATHTDISGTYGCLATMTVVTFVACGLVHRARRFFRADLAGTGKIELYTLCPYNTSEHGTEQGYLESTTSEDWLGYADEFNPSNVDAAAMCAIAAASQGTYIPTMGFESSARFAAMELV